MGKPRHDKNGKLIHIGDTINCYNGQHTFVVVGFDLDGDPKKKINSRVGWCYANR